MQLTSSWYGRRPALLAGVAAIAVALSLLALPPVRAVADDLLSVFRVQKIVFVPISPDRMQQLQNLKLEGKTLFVDKPTVDRQAEPRTVASAAEASSAVGYNIAQLANLPSPPLSTEFTVVGPSKGHFQVDVAAARQVLDLLGIQDVTIPDSLGASPIAVETPAFVATRYRGANYDITLHQGASPNVTLPEGVELAQLGKVALRVLGMTPEQAEAASQSINWNNTLIFPFPQDMNNVRQVTVGGQNALLTSAGPRGSERWQLYWQRGDRLYMLEGRGDMGEEDMVNLLVTAAESVS
ncbi:MAG TPA: anti-sigma factor [Roseiflexaceae bacterium]